MWRIFFSSFFVLVLASCGSTTYDSFRPVQDRNVDIAYVNVNADFSRYRKLMIEEMGIYYPSNSNLSEADIQRVRTAFREAFRQQLEGYEIVTRPAADVLKVRASLVDLTGDPVVRLPNVAREINEILEPGKLSFMIEMLDSQTESVLLRAADTEESPNLDQPEDGTGNSSEVLAAAEHWARLFRNFLDKNLT